MGILLCANANVRQWVDMTVAIAQRNVLQLYGRCAINAVNEPESRAVSAAESARGGAAADKKRIHELARIKLRHVKRRVCFTHRRSPTYVDNTPRRVLAQQRHHSFEAFAKAFRRILVWIGGCRRRAGGRRDG